MSIKKECFAYLKEYKECNALTQIDCTNCKFYKKKQEIKNNPFYAYSYKNIEQLKQDLEKRKIRKEEVRWYY